MQPGNSSPSLLILSTSDETRKKDEGREFTSFVQEDDEHLKAEQLLCLSERMLAYHSLFPPGTEFSHDPVSKRICVVTDRYSSRSGSILLVKPLHHEALTILADGILPDCDKCNSGSGS